MTKANKDMTEAEFYYSLDCKRMMNNLLLLEDNLRNAKTIRINGLSKGALANVEGRIYDLKAAILNAMKTVGT